MTSIQEVMTANPRTVEPSTPLVEAARLMQTEDVVVLPIIEGDRLTGMITDRYITIRAVAAGMDAQTTTVGQMHRATSSRSTRSRRSTRPCA